MTIKNGMNRIYELVHDEKLENKLNEAQAEKQMEYQKRIFEEKLGNILEASYKQNPETARAEIVLYDGEGGGVFFCIILRKIMIYFFIHSNTY